MKQPRLATFVDVLYRRLRDIETIANKKHLPRGTTSSDVRVLRAVDIVGALGVCAIAENLGISQPAATVAIGRIENKGLVVRTSHASDGRRKALVLTPRGRQVEQMHIAANGDAAERISASVPKIDRATLSEMLAMVASPKPSAY